MKNQSNNQAIIGIDAGVKTGIFIFENGKPKQGLLFENFWELIAFFEENKDALFVLEDPRKNKPTFGVDYAITTIKKGGFSLKVLRQTLNGFARKGQNVGNVKTRTEIIADYFTHNNLDHLCMKPIQGLKNQQSKGAFLSMTKDIKTLKNQHTQDAFWYAWYINQNLIKDETDTE